MVELHVYFQEGGGGGLGVGHFIDRCIIDSYLVWQCA